MNELQTVWVFQIEVDASDTTLVDLPPKLSKVCAEFMPHPCRSKQTTTIASLKNSNAKVDIFPKAHVAETTQLLIDLTTDTHVE